MIYKTEMEYKIFAPEYYWKSWEEYLKENEN